MFDLDAMAACEARLRALAGEPASGGAREERRDAAFLSRSEAPAPRTCPFAEGARA